MRNYQLRKAAMTTSELTPAQKAWQAEQQFLGRFSAAEISSMSMSEFAALTGRKLVTGPTVPEYVPEPVPEPVPERVPEPVHEGVPGPVSEARGIDVLEMSPAQYAQVRASLGMGCSQKEGRGIFDSVDSRSEEYRDAVRRQAGRTAMSQSNVVQPPRLAGRYLIPEAPVTGRRDFYR
jgi:hypothetical protein